MQNLTTRQSSRETVSTISSKGQVTLPVEVRKHLGVEPNDKVAFIIEPTGNVKVTHVKYPDIQSLRGVAGTLKQPLSLQEIREIAREDRLTNKYGK
ncbi:MAG: Looped-hinge helix DNA binding domain, AbrB family [Candidatus Daviesbacteria bacterium GW2011_GWA2_38_24]|uniref:Looped-hinge helix DNA binding domain, AbrB family n=1 Tax=Candidatus Daviesbacteria bacterium GW2011_GWA2_38_24 TaxID=1618422 RepID=A0A0G0JUU7_9BACT|nr:MAG: Looped-hinge helix DNA binding domain, AbrB family [Candidatus Daviesbacteria bacterium GW2011_GWA2_38_24]KKQ79338.1 MAG: Looped-hinge helix DNA binding domain, AbrB family [Candidatus Daviesbacteria bacterium GW2011_GWA1_38_7]OGE24075.1 MAG: hypothetical protein A2688_01310 [Candidatus Daviesbacteria bacterium RIFCSPHIGHO2_01_FULL_38_8]